MSSLETAEVCTVCVRGYICMCGCMLATQSALCWPQGGHFNSLCILSLSCSCYQVLFYLSVNLSFCLAHRMCDSYPVNSQLLSCPHAIQSCLWRRSSLLHAKGSCGGSVKARLFCEGRLQTVSEETFAKPLVSQLSCLKDATRHFVYIMPSVVGVALVLYLPTLFPATSLLINQKSVRIHFLPLRPFHYTRWQG